jgi:hypothetical protein
MASSLKFPQPLSSGLLDGPSPAIRMYFNKQRLAIDEARLSRELEYRLRF